MFPSKSGVAIFCLVWSVWIVSSSALHTKFKPRRDMHVVFQWSQIEFDYPSESRRKADINSGRFREATIIPVDCDVYHSGNNTTIFMSTPSFHSGVPVTIGTVTNRSRNGNPIIAPYPSWSWHDNSAGCAADKISSAFRIMIDECERLWILDTGPLNVLESCPARILAFDLRTNELLVRYEIPSRVLLSTSFLVTIVIDVVDERDNCRNTFVYIADAGGFQLIVYDLLHNTSWAIRDRTMYPYPDYGIFDIAGQRFYTMFGILGMSLTPKGLGDGRRLFYHATSSPTENWVYASFLRNETFFRNNPLTATQIFHTYRSKRSSQSDVEAMDRDGILYYSLMGDIKIACFNTQGEYGNEHSSSIVADNRVTLQVPTGMKVISYPQRRQELWTLTSRFQKFATGTMYNPNETNFRILAANVDDLVSGTSCRRSQPPGLINKPNIYLP